VVFKSQAQPLIPGSAQKVWPAQIYGGIFSLGAERR